MESAIEDDLILASVFEERAEYLSAKELEQWTTYTPRDEQIIKKLLGPGAKLLIGPRGSGKSTLLRSAYYRSLSAGDVLPVYVNYARSLALEPLFHKHAAALQLFRQWLVYKIIVSTREIFERLKLPLPADLAQRAAIGRALIDKLENGFAPDSLDDPISPNALLGMLEMWASLAQRSRCVLLLDDAAHAFSPEQQREFFEVFREIRSRRVSGKAAVYPGVTSYSPHFHVGHEAELLEVWFHPEEEGYLDAMRALVAKRLPQELSQKLSDRQDLVDYLALAAFGLPRGFLTMLSQLLGIEEGSNTKPSRQGAETSVAAHAQAVRGVFSALSGKLPRFRKFVQVGKELESALVRTLRIYNKLQTTASKKAQIVGIEEPLPPELQRMLNLLEYAGIVRNVGTVSRGVKGRFARYAVHYALLVTENALSLGKSYSTAQVVDSLKTQDAHAFARIKPTALLGDGFEARCTLELPPCASCGTPRVSEEQHFCLKCGAELKNVSVYEELLRASIDRLPLTTNKLTGIRGHTTLRTIQDVLLDDEAQQLRKVPYIGPVWSARIRTYAEEYVSV